MRIPPLLAATTLLGAAPAPRRPSMRVSSPCTTATTACEQWVMLAGGPARSMVYSTYALDVPNPSITRAFILIHGTNRNADHYFGTATAAAFLAGALDNTVVIAPHIIDGQDTPQANEVVWPNRGDSWRSGGMSTSHPTLSTFDFMDEIIRTL